MRCWRGKYAKGEKLGVGALPLQEAHARREAGRLAAPETGDDHRPRRWEGREARADEGIERTAFPEGNLAVSTRNSPCPLTQIPTLGVTLQEHSHRCTEEDLPKSIHCSSVGNGRNWGTTQTSINKKPTYIKCSIATQQTMYKANLCVFVERCLMYFDRVGKTS